MAEIRYEDEADLQRKIKDILNKSGYHFKIVPNKFDIIDLVRKIYIEVKRDDFAPAQILYAIGKEETKKVKYIGLACAFEVRFYNSPSIEVIKEFARSIDPSLKKSPSAIKRKKWNNEAFDILGDHIHIYTYKGKCDLKKRNKTIFLDDENYEYFKILFEKYEINPTSLITFIVDVHAKNHEIIINNKGWIINTNTLQAFRNTDEKQKGIGEFLGEYSYRPIRDFRDRTLFSSLRIRGNNIGNVLHQIDRLEPIEVRRYRGRFFTKDVINNEIVDIVKKIKPDYILEPFVGSGSLIRPVITNYNGHANDINDGFINTLKKTYNGLNWTFTSIDTWMTPARDLVKDWGIPIGRNILILTNPPFGTSSTGKVASRKGEIKDGKKSRKTKIEYGGLGDRYGRGDLVLPAIAQCIEILKETKMGYLATFSPAGVMLGRVNYSKVLKALLKDFDFIEGHIFNGKDFNSVNSDKAITFTIWKYNKNVNTDIESLTFMVEGKLWRVKKMLLLKDGWRYRDGNKYVKTKKEGVLGVKRCEAFNTSNGKFFSINLKEGSGAELAKENIKIDLGIPNIPSELVYGLWSVCVGYKAIIKSPLHIKGAYTHLPDFSKQESKEVLAYILIHALITELIRVRRYCKGKVGFVGMQRIFIFGEERFTNGAEYLINEYKECPITDKRIIDVFNELKNEPDISKVNPKYRGFIKKEIEKRLERIGYWDYIPIPNINYKE